MAFSDVYIALKEQVKLTAHYYGDVIRTLFLLSAIIQLISLPFVYTRIPVRLIYAIAPILFLVVFAAFTNPKQKWTIFADSFVAIGGFLIFEYYAVDAYLKYGASDTLFIVNQSISVCFIFAVYYSVKTVRGIIVKIKYPKEQ